MPKLGTLDWVKQTGGCLSFREKISMTVAAVKATLATNRRLKEKIKRRHLEVDDIVPPDSAIAKEAAAICEEASPSSLFNHSMRSYFWARLLVEPSVKFDDEAVFSAFMLHDLGLCEGHRLSHQKDQCFTLVGARKVEELARKHDWTGKRAALAANAITLHLNVTVDAIHGPEAQLVRLGSGADVASLGLDVLEKDQIETVVQRFARLDFKKQILSDLKTELIERPCCRIAFMQRSLGFRKLIRNSKFRE